MNMSVSTSRATTHDKAKPVVSGQLEYHVNEHPNCELYHLSRKNNQMA
ncbi:uncharacterized protein Nmag_3885 (plasmid) [Natrialba magadii ATCC 43099]|uniref:Uncharacterized protein n=1 Tax=Natrialba magadii (strain ATCC 43099 / DSM 3394 / CCM 3739 / CIP 104546 / IAM 13178 / JCM 8861 / NBRC 102185 / NCIMB 2190 / MS3) TaxID=547559 RepID=D3T1G7_NATMM|nr:uncharacterized protein Nmag_3885 [Natrialba magadii ATCC 43099]